VTRPTPEPDAPADEPAEIIVVDITDGPGLPPPDIPHNTTALGSSPMPVHKTVDPTGMLGADIGYGPRIGMHTASESDGSYTLPMGHFGSGLGDRSSPVQPTICPTRRDTTAANAHAAHMAGPAGRTQRLATGPVANPYTSSCPPSRSPQITPPVIVPTSDNGTHGRPSLPGFGGPILSLHQKRTKGVVNQFNIEALAHPLYHGRADGVHTLMEAFLENCGYNMIPTDNVVGSLHDIITAHRRVLETWHNASSHTYGPQIDRILLKSFQLFPQLESMSTDDVVNFYDCFQELSNPHLMALMPFDSIVLKNRYKGLFIPGLGTQRYAACGRALMDFLPRLILGTLLSRINATLTAVRCETMNGYDFLWRVLELCAPGFNQVVAIQTPQWADCDDIFLFTQAYLLYFRLQGKMNYHYTDRTRSGIFLQAIQQLDYADTVTTLQSHVNLY
jgi:hypothetical protein